MEGILKKFGIFAMTVITFVGLATTLVSCEDAWPQQGLTDENDIRVCLTENTNIVVGGTLHKGSAFIYAPHVNLDKFKGNAVETNCGKQIVTGNYQAYVKGEPTPEIDYKTRCPDCFDKELE